MKKNTIALILGCLLGIGGYAQKLIRSYYDYNHTKVKEEYYTDNYGVKTGSYKFYSEFGGILVQGAYKKDKLVGHWITKDEKGTLVADENYDDEGNFNGISTYYKDGHKYMVKHYSHGVKTGNWKTWYSTEDGENAYSQLHYDENYKNDKDDSLYTEYTIQGKIAKQSHYTNGSLNGEEDDYNNDGVLVVKKNFANGNVDGEATYYDINGSGEIMTHGVFKDGKFWGKWKITCDANFNETENKSQVVYYRIIDFSGDLWKATDYYITGEKQGEETLVKIAPDVIVGHYAAYYKNGHIQEVGREDDQGKPDTIITGYYESGQVSQSATYSHGKLNSSFISYYEDGKIFVKGICKDNCRIGQWNIYDKTGNLVFMEDYSTALQPTMHFFKEGKDVYTVEDAESFGGEGQPECTWPWPTQALMSIIAEHTK